MLFETDDSYVFGQEYAPAGDLFDIIPPQVKSSSALLPTVVLAESKLLQSVAVFKHSDFNKPLGDWSLIFVLFFWGGFSQHTLSLWFSSIPVDVLGVLDFTVRLRSH